MDGDARDVRAAARARGERRPAGSRRRAVLDPPGSHAEPTGTSGRTSPPRGRRFTGGVAKFFIDGVIDAGTGWLFEPDTLGEGMLPFWPDPEQLPPSGRALRRRGLPVCDPRHRRPGRARDAERVPQRRRGAGNPSPGRAHRDVRRYDLHRFAAEGVVASMQAQHMRGSAPDRDDNWSRRLGPERCDRAFPIRSLRESGAVVTLGSDWPVAHFDPRVGLAAARLRRPPGERERRAYDDEALDGLAALRATRAPPRTRSAEEDRLGRIATGYAADLTVLAEDPVVVRAGRAAVAAGAAHRRGRRGHPPRAGVERGEHAARARPAHRRRRPSGCGRRARRARPPSPGARGGAATRGARCRRPPR